MLTRVDLKFFGLKNAYIYDAYMLIKFANAK